MSSPRRHLMPSDWITCAWYWRSVPIRLTATYGLTTAARAAKSFSFLSHPLYRSYIFTYSIGYDLIMGTADPATTFRRLLTEQVLPSRLTPL